jgi:hypothetical protein
MSSGEQSFFSLVRSYSVREMKRQEDALPTFSGLLTALSSPRTDFWHLMPLAYFHQALLFSTNKASRRPELPSWSWLGWRLDLPSYRDQWPEPGRHKLDYGITINLTPQSMYNFPTEKTPVTELKDKVEWFRYELKDEAFIGKYVLKFVISFNKIMRVLGNTFDSLMLLLEELRMVE